MHPRFLVTLCCLVLLTSGCAASTPPSRELPTPAASRPASAPVSSKAEASAGASSTTVKPAAEGTALAALALLPVKGRAPMTGYSREAFGKAWTDNNTADLGRTSGNSCSTLDDLRKVWLYDVVMSGRCEVVSGTLHDPYTGKVIRFVKDASTEGEPELDHVVSLGNAFATGAQQLSFEQRVNLANDPLNLILVDGPSNQAKSDGDAATWLPPNRGFTCTLISRQISIKAKYVGLYVTAPEKAAMERELVKCPGQMLPTDGLVRLDPQGKPAPGATLPAGLRASAVPAAEPSAASAPAAGSDPDYGSCAKANAAGKGPYMRGTDPEYAYYRDGDGDGTVCE